GPSLFGNPANLTLATTYSIPTETGTAPFIPTRMEYSRTFTLGPGTRPTDSTRNLEQETHGTFLCLAPIPSMPSAPDTWSNMALIHANPGSFTKRTSMEIP